MMRHKWEGRGVHEDGAESYDLEQCAHCETERRADTSTKSLFLYRRGRAIPPGHEPRQMDERWAAYNAGVIPKCPGVAR